MQFKSFKNVALALVEVDFIAPLLIQFFVYLSLEWLLSPHLTFFFILSVHTWIFQLGMTFPLWTWEAPFIMGETNWYFGVHGSTQNPAGCRSQMFCFFLRESWLISDDLNLKCKIFPFNCSPQRNWLWFYNGALQTWCKPSRNGHKMRHGIQVGHTRTSRDLEMEPWRRNS